MLVLLVPTLSRKTRKVAVNMKATQPVEAPGAGMATQPVEAPGAGMATQPVEAPGAGMATQPVEATGAGPKVLLTSTGSDTVQLDQ